jgi:pimeloyl-ACP methyl ester carboxylesterase
VRRPATTHPSSLWLDVLRARVPGAVINLVSNTGHFMMLERPPLIADWVKDRFQTDHTTKTKNSAQYPINT